MATPQPDPASSGGRSDPGPNLPEVPKKRPGQGVWTHKDGGPGPAEWRKQKGKVRGQARRKGEKNPMKFGLAFDDDLLGHPKMENWKELPPLKAPKKSKELKKKKEPKAAGPKEKKCVVM